MTNPAEIARRLQDNRPTPTISTKATDTTRSRCELTDLFPDECACRLHRNIQEEVKKNSKRATWRGVCRCCLVNVIEPGTLIEPYEGGWKLVDCDA